MSKILIIDDEPEILDIVASLLDLFLEDSKVFKASKGQMGIEIAKKERPDTILLDINMPEMDGYEVCGTLKSDPDTQNIPVIILTGVQTDSHSKIKALDLGADVFLPKPIKEGELIAHVKAMLRIKLAEDELKKEKELLNFLVKQRTEELNKARKRYQHLYDFAPDLYFSVRKDGNIISVNRNGASSLGYNHEELVGKPIWEIFHPEEISSVKSQIQKIFDKKIVNGEWEFRQVHKNGDVIWVQEKTFLFLNEKGYAKELLIMCRDVTAQKIAEESLRESEQHYRTLFEHGNDAILLSSQTKDIIDANIQAVKLLGYDKSELIKFKFGTLLKSLNHKDSQPPEFSDLKINDRFEYETHILHKDESIIPVQVSITPLQRKNKNLYLIMLRDLSERKKVEEEVQKSQKLESIGILAGGLAHDFNNRLSVILGNAQLGRMSLENGGEVDKYFANIEKGAIQATTLTQQLLTFSKGGSPVKKFYSIKTLISEAVELSLSGSKTGLKSELPDELWAVEVDEGQIVQVFNNLIINADQAMADGGLLTITAENLSKRSKKIHAALKNGDYIRITIQDQGIGIPQANLDKIFDPYFTTKQQGSGLGLAVAYSIIKKHDGLLTAQSELGKGSVFEIYLPAEPDYVLEPVVKEDEQFIGKGRVLVMDDEEAVLSVVDNYLTISGYDVEIAKDGNEAIEMYKKAAGEKNGYNVVIMDLTIPGGIGGGETMEILKEFDPEINAVVSSGYSNDPIMANYEDYGFKGVIAKPYRMNELGKVLNRIFNNNVS